MEKMSILSRSLSLIDCAQQRQTHSRHCKRLLARPGSADAGLRQGLDAGV
jgi:hypothetical protein